MNEIKEKQIKIKEIRAEDFIKFLIINITKGLKLDLYNIFKLLSNKNYNINININKDKNINQNESNTNNLNKIIYIFNNIKNLLETFNDYLNKFNNNQYKILPFDYSRIQYSFYYNKNFERNNFVNNIFIYLIDFSNNNFIKEIIKAEKKFNENRLIKSRAFKIYKLINNETINIYINEYIRNMFKEQQINNNIRLKDENELITPKIFFNCNISTIYYNNEKIAEIYIKYFIFDIYIKMPYEKLFNHYYFCNKIKISIKSKYSGYNKDSFKSIKKNYKLNIKKNFKNLLLIKKIKNLFETRIYLIIISIINEKKLKIKVTSDLIEKRNDFFGEDVLIELCKRFINYIYDYNKLFKTKCAVCNKIVKYSLTEKCFLPPYLKIYKEVFNLKNSLEENINSFFHEECFKKIASESI